MDDYKEFIHFGLTSQDINNTSVPLSIKKALDKVYYPLIEELIAQLKTYATDWADIPMLAKTHGQPASPTRLGKEVMVFVYRLERQLAMLKACPITAKFGGATGNYNAHHVAYPQYDWKQFGNRFVAEKLGLEREEYTTQISNYDNLSAVFDAMKRINTIMVDMNRDFWQYISMEYFKQKIKAGEVGSSAMPHKVNPIDFENAEGNLGIATSILEHLAVKLPVSRLQRDLTDSTVLRNVGVPFAETPDLASELIADIIVERFVLDNGGLQSAREPSLHVALVVLAERHERGGFDVFLLIYFEVAKLCLGPVDEVDVDVTGKRRIRVVPPERLLDLVGIVNEVQDEGVVLVRMDAVHSAERLHRLDILELLVDDHGVQQWLVESVWYFSATMRTSP